jgi:hypothetical protein
VIGEELDLRATFGASPATAQAGQGTDTPPQGLA